MRLTNYEVIKQMRRPKVEDEDRGDEVWSSPPSKRRCRSPVGNGFNVVKPTFGGGEAELPYVSPLWVMDGRVLTW